MVPDGSPPGAGAGRSPTGAPAHASNGSSPRASWARTRLPNHRRGPWRRGRCGRCSTASRGVYDLMNTAMTAGLHHRWRERAADLARVGPGDRVLDVATGTGDLAIELARRVAPGGEVIGSDFSEAMLARARTQGQARRRRAALRVGRRAGAAVRRRTLRRRHGRLRRPQLLRPPARSGRDGPRRAPRRARSGARDHHPHTSAAVDSSTASGSIGRRSPLLGAPRGGATRRRLLPTCPTRSSASRRRRAGGSARARGSREIGYLLTAGGIVAIHDGTVAPQGS